MLPLHMSGPPVLIPPGMIQNSQRETVVTTDPIVSYGNSFLSVGITCDPGCLSARL